MRQYRGKRKDTGEWVKGWYLKSIDNEHIIWFQTKKLVEHGLKEEIETHFHEVIPETVGQSTGLKDKNGVEIFERDKLKDDVGDIGIVRFGKLPLDKSGDCVCTYQAYYLECLGRLGRAPTFECANIGSWMEVIGNIHEEAKDDS